MADRISQRYLAVPAASEAAAWTFCFAFFCCLPSNGREVKRLVDQGGVSFFDWGFVALDVSIGRIY